jgi:hypothetical protein
MERRGSARVPSPSRDCISVLFPLPPLTVRVVRGREAPSDRIFSECRMQRIVQSANGCDGSSPASRYAVSSSVAVRQPRIDPVMMYCSTLPVRGRRSGELSLTKFSRRTAANMEVVLDEVFGGVPNGGDHESRKYVAERLLRSARMGNVTLDGLRAVGRNAFRQLPARRTADAVSVIPKFASPNEPAKR